MTKDQNTYKLKRPLPIVKNERDEALRIAYRELHEHINRMIQVRGLENMFVATSMMMASFYTYTAMTVGTQETSLVIETFERAIRIGTKLCVAEEMVKEMEKNDQGETVRDKDNDTPGESVN